MSNKTTNQQTEKQRFVMQAQVIVNSFKGDDGLDHEYVAIELIDPFSDPDFVHVPIVPKWKSDSAVFKFHAKKALRLTDVIPFDVELQARSYKNKNGKTVTYPALIGKSPFENRMLEFSVKGDRDSEKHAVFSYLANNLLGLNNNAPEEFGLSDDE